MAQKKAKALSQDPQIDIVAQSAPRPRLHKLRVSNFRCIGDIPVEIELDDIVVLVGPNNSGKSALLRAYEVVMQHGSKEGELTIEDFPNRTVCESSLPTIELETVVFDKTAPGERWVRTDPATNEMYVREKWTWAGPGAPKKVGWDVTAEAWHASEGPWGTPNVAQAYRPKPYRVTAFDNPEKQAEQVAEVLREAITARVKEASKKKAEVEGGEEQSDYEKLLESIKVIQKSIATDAASAVEDMRSDLEKMVSEVFPGYCVSFDARPEDDVEKTVSLFKTAPMVRMGPSGAHQAPIDRQGSGTVRTLLWVALRILAERQTSKKEAVADRAKLLLIDEPELCLHPDAIREACRVLYDLPKSGTWQVMVTTHSPVFVDFSRDNTSIVRVERGETGAVQGTTIFRPARAKLDDNDRAELKLLNHCDPYVAEFFFGGRTIVVEGDTEYTAFRHVIAENPGTHKGIHVVRARGKACIISLCKILNQFDKGYAVLHDSDREKSVSKKTGMEHANSAWTENGKILDVTADGRQRGRVRLLASIPNFEEAYLHSGDAGDKPYSALMRLRSDAPSFDVVVSLLEALADPTKTPPKGALEWSAMDDLATAVREFDGSSAKCAGDVDSPSS